MQFFDISYQTKIKFPNKTCLSKDALYEGNLPLVVMKVSEVACCQGAQSARDKGCQDQNRD